MAVDPVEQPVTTGLGALDLGGQFVAETQPSALPVGNATSREWTAVVGIIIEGTFTGLSSPVRVIGPTGSSMHLHRSEAAPFDQTIGLVLRSVDVDTDLTERSGTFFLTFLADGETLGAILRGETYLNLHTQDWPAGELRVQLTF